MLAILAAAALFTYPAIVVGYVDGDTVKIHVARFPAPFDPIDVRVYGIDTPEKARPPAAADCEVGMGLKASLFAHTLVKPGDKVTVTWRRGWKDKFGRLLGSVTLPDGRDWASTMIAAGLGRPYGADGNLHKAPWCADPVPTPVP